MTHDFLKARLEHSTRELDAALRHATDADLTWRPAPGLRSIAGQLLEIANKEKETLGWLKTGVWPDGGPDAFDTATATLAEIADVRSDLRRETYAFIDSLSEEQLDGLFESPEGWWEALELRQCPVSEILRNIAVHEWYHTGQLVIYFWMRGIDPYET